MDETQRQSMFEQARNFVTSEMPDLCERLMVPSRERERFHNLFMASLVACASKMQLCCSLGLVEPIPEARALVDFVGTYAVGSESGLIDVHHLETAFRFLREGGNVLLVSNHTSGADTLVLDYLINRHYSNLAATTFAYMAGHVVNIFLIPLTIAGAWRRFQIFSAKYKSAMALQDCDAEEAMGRQNKSAIRELMQYAKSGRRVVVLYPEGGRGENGQMLEGEPRTTAIHKAIARVSPDGFMVLPSFVSGATSILPVSRGEDEFSRFLSIVSRGDSRIRFGQPMLWETLAPSDTEVKARCTMACAEGTALPEPALHSIMFNRMVCSRTMDAIRAIAS